MLLRTGWFAMVLAVGSSACGGDEALSDTRTLGSLSPAEQRLACRRLQTRFTRVDDAYAQISCTLTAFTISNGDRNDCATQRADCIASAKTTPDNMFDLNCDSDDAGNLTSCGDLTVGEMNACADSIATMAESAAAKVDCSSTSDTIASTTSALQRPAECQALSDECPDVAARAGLR